MSIEPRRFWKMIGTEVEAITLSRSSREASVLLAARGIVTHGDSSIQVQDVPWDLVQKVAARFVSINPDVNRRVFDDTCEPSVRSRRFRENLRTIEYVTLPRTNLETLVEDVSFLIDADLVIPELINRTCGGHIHVSLEGDASYAALVSPLFFRRFVGEYQERFACVPEAMERLNNNQYCSSKTPHRKVLEAVYRGNEDRYKAVNFCLNKHGTVEFRIFPAASSASAFRAYAEFAVGFIDRYLSRYFRKGKPITMAKKTSELPNKFSKGVGDPFVLDFTTESKEEGPVVCEVSNEANDFGPRQTHV